MMHGREKSDPAIVAKKPANNAGESAAEAMERRAGAEENASQQRTRRTQSRESVSQTPKRVRTAARFYRHYPRWEPDAGGALGEAGMSLPVQVWPVQSLASRTGASLTGVTWGPERRQRLGGVWDRLPKSAYCGGRAGACTSEGSTSALATREGVMHRRGLRPGHVRTAHAGT